MPVHVLTQLGLLRVGETEAARVALQLQGEVEAEDRPLDRCNGAPVAVQRYKWAKGLEAGP